MADLPDTICFKSPRWLTDRLRVLATEQRRSLAQMVRVLLEQKLEEVKVPDDSI